MRAREFIRVCTTLGDVVWFFSPLHHGMTEAVETSKAASEEECDTAKTKRPSFLATFFFAEKK